MDATDTNRGFIVRAVPIIAVALAAVVAGVFNTAQSYQPPTAATAIVTPATKPYGVDKADFKETFAYRASTSCSAAACHGGGAVGKVGSEHSTWAREAVSAETSDPHAKAYSVLFNPVSVKMGKALGISAPHKDARCLACHAVDSAKDSSTRDQILSEGVGCGACHGPADKWISEHTLPSWKARSNQEKWTAFGFVPTKNLVARALNCASCHVGDGERDMNHDFIAAGHPRLAFEPARFHFQPDYRKHWTEKGDGLSFEVRTWVIGQAATLRASVNLLHERAKKADAPNEKAPWPEFSGYSCYACHQTVGDTETRGSLSATRRTPGLPGWEVWSNTTVDVAAKSCELAFPGISSPELRDIKLPAVDELRKLMGAKRAPAPAEVAKRAKAAVDELDGWLANLQAAEDRGSGTVARDTPEKIAHRLAVNALSSDGKTLADHDWDALAANYLGTAAMYHATGGKTGTGARWHDPLLAIDKNLRFPPIANGPVKFDRFKLDPIRDSFESLRTKTSTPEGK